MLHIAPIGSALFFFSVGKPSRGGGWQGHGVFCAAVTMERRKRKRAREIYWLMNRRGGSRRNRKE